MGGNRIRDFCLGEAVLVLPEMPSAVSWSRRRSRTPQST
jgi:hypothetical protein